MKPRGRAFLPGNKFGTGRPQGSRNKTTAMAQKLLEKYSEPIVRRCIVDALNGDRDARRACIDRIIPVLREAGVRIRLGKIETAQDVSKAAEQVLLAMAGGRMKPSDGERLARVLDMHRQAIETAQLEARIEKLEQKDSE